MPEATAAAQDPAAPPRRRGRPKLNPADCVFPDCKRPAITRGLCHAHIVQFYRKGDILGLTPIRRRGGKGVRLPGVFVGEEVRDALMRKGPTVYLATRRVLENWALGEPPDENPPPLEDPEP